MVAKNILYACLCTPTHPHAQHSFFPRIHGAITANTSIYKSRIERNI